MPFDTVKQTVKAYYSKKIAEHGPTASGVDWNSTASQELRFEQLLKMVRLDQPFTLNDYGCGYGALVDYLAVRAHTFEYHGYDLSEAMVAQARTLHTTQENCHFTTEVDDLSPTDYTVASGIFNVRQQTDDETWLAYIFETLQQMNHLSSRGFAFNVLTSYSDAAYMRPDLYYADPCVLFDYCKRHFSRNVALLHDYELYEFTVLVRL